MPTAPGSQISSPGPDFYRSIAGNPLNDPVANQFENSLHGPGFFANPRLVLIVREAIQQQASRYIFMLLGHYLRCL